MHVYLRLLRNRKLALALLLVAVMVGVALWDPAPGASQPAVQTNAGTLEARALQFTWHSHPRMAARAQHDTDALSGSAERGHVARLASTAEGSGAYIHESGTLKAPNRFNAVGFHWDGYIPDGVEVLIDARASEDGVIWSQWWSLEELDSLSGTGIRDTDLLFTSGRFLQYRVALEHVPTDTDWEPSLNGIRVTFIDSTGGPQAEDIEPSASQVARLAGLSQPSVIPRHAWGAEERYRFAQGREIYPQEYAPVEKIIIHHTASRNNPPNPAASIRAIYYYHAVTQGWGDIGYNYLIDPDGRIYEGRAGGRGVVGAQAIQYNEGSLGIGLLGNFSAGKPSAKLRTSLEQLVVAKVVEFGIEPHGSGFFVDKEVPNIAGHRDVLPTNCPGGFVYALLPALRDAVSRQLPPYGEAWLAHDTPQIMDPGQEVIVPLSVKNSGTAVWNIQTTNPVRLGYRWYNMNGTPYAGNAGIEFHTPLAASIHPGQTLTQDAVLRAPTEIGRYQLKWDMVHERVSWFEEQGNQPLSLSVTVLPYSTLTVPELVTLPNELLTLLPPKLLERLPLSRLTVLSNTEIVRLIPHIVQLFPNGRLLSFSNELLLSYLPDDRLKTFSRERIATFPLPVQQRLGLAPTPTRTPPSRSGATPTPTTPVGPRQPGVGYTATPSGGGATRVEFTPTPVSTAVRVEVPPTPARTAVRVELTPTPTPTPASTPTWNPDDSDPGGAVAE